MKLASHLKRSPHGVYYFRFVIPLALRPLYGGHSEHKRSLQTKDPATARKLAYMLWAQTSCQLNKARELMSGYDPKKFNPNDASTWPTSADALHEWKINIGGVSIEADPRIPGDTEGALKAVRILAPSHRYLPDDPAAPWNVGRVPSSMPAPPTPPVPVDTTIRFSQAKDIYLQLVQRETGKGAEEQSKSLARKTLMEMRGVFEHFLAWTKPHDPQLSAIDERMIERYMQHLLLEEPNKRTKEKGLSQATVKKNLSFLNGLFTNRKGDFPKGHGIPTTGVNPYRKGTQKRIQKNSRYRPFSSDELKAIFALSNMTKLTKPHEFWVPLLGLYLGARLEEICQLRLADVEQTPYLVSVHIRKEEATPLLDDGTRLKSENSERSLALHNDLIDLGFLHYLDDVRSLVPNGRVFPYLHFSSNGYGDVPSEAFARYLDKLGIVHEKKTFHSFRSTLNNHLKTVTELPEELRSLYLGQAVESTNDRHYSDNLNAQDFSSLVVSKFRFPELDELVREMKYERGHFVPVLKKELARRTKHLKRQPLIEARKLHRQHAAKP